MEIITAAITAALSSLGVKAIEDAYHALKTTFKKKYGEGSEIVEAIEKVEKNPDSAGRRETLKEEIALTGADKDEELLTLAQKLKDLIKTEGTPEGKNIINVSGGTVQGLVQDNRGGSVSMDFGNSNK